jgi:hypothetical protein
VQSVLQLQHDGRAFFAGYQLLAFSQKVQFQGKRAQNQALWWAENGSGWERISAKACS